jgi:hypothetical protein
MGFRPKCGLFTDGGFADGIQRHDYFYPDGYKGGFGAF